MEMCYDGALVMPSSYAVMGEDEMTYVEGGGTVKVIASKATVRTICQNGAGLIGAAIGAMFGGGAGAIISAGFGSIVYNYIIDICGVKYKAINKSWTKSWLPTCTFNLNKYV